MADILKSITVALGASSLTVGATTEAKASATIEASDEMVSDDFSITWSSSNPAVAGVSAAGTVTAVSAGTATIIATSGAVQGSAAIMVQSLPVVKIDAAGGALIAGLPIGAKFQLQDPSLQTFTCQKNFS